MELDGPETSENAAEYGTVYTHGLVTVPGLHNSPSNQETCCTVATCPYRPVSHKFHMPLHVPFFILQTKVAPFRKYFADNNSHAGGLGPLQARSLIQ
jgi:hypothetical protein